MSSFNSNSNNSSFDSLVLQSLMGRLQLRPPFLNTNSILPQTLEDFFLDPNSINNDSNSDNDDSDRTPLAKEESKLEREIIRLILGGNSETLKPNSGQAVSIGEHHICVGFHEEPGSDYRVWEWHGHIMLFDEENGYTPEYIYGNYFERLLVRTPNFNGQKKEKKKQSEDEEEKEEKDGNLGGLKELIDASGNSVSGRILRRSMNAASRS